MKTIYFVRHAKSSWDDPMLRDHDRPLNKRGLRDAPRMAARLADLGCRPDGILTSSARRARQTMAYFADALGVDKKRILVREDLYHAWPDAITAEIRLLPEEWDTVLLFGHNPGYTALANALRNDAYIENVPTCGVVAGRTSISSWADFRMADTSRVAYLYPKQIS